MDETQRAAFVISQSICCMAEMEAMKAENDARARRGYTQAFTSNQFMELPDKYGLGHNTIIQFLNQ